jgi:hypothetical protein
MRSSLDLGTDYTDLCCSFFSSAHPVRWNIEIRQYQSSVPVISTIVSAHLTLNNFCFLGISSLSSVSKEQIMGPSMSVCLSHSQSRASPRSEDNPGISTTRPPLVFTILRCGSFLPGLCPLQFVSLWGFTPRALPPPPPPSGHCTRPVGNPRASTISG